MNIKTIVIHHTASSRDKTTLFNVDDWHRARDFTRSSLGCFVGYHFLILGNGQLIRTRQDNEIGCHCIPNEGKLGVCLTGNFDIEIPNPAQIDTLVELLSEKKTQYGLTDKNIKAHRELSNTSCPGNSLMGWLNTYRSPSVQNLSSWLNALKKKLLDILKVVKSKN
jgi:hypothetical protein